MLFRSASKWKVGQNLKQSLRTVCLALIIRYVCTHVKLYICILYMYLSLAIWANSWAASKGFWLLLDWLLSRSLRWLQRQHRKQRCDCGVRIGHEKLLHNATKFQVTAEAHQLPWGQLLNDNFNAWIEKINLHIYIFICIY